MGPKLLMLKGLPASGKSSYARQLVKEGHGKTVAVTKDEIREQLVQKTWNFEVEKEVVRIRDFKIGEALSKGYTAISADTNLAPKHEDTLRALARKWKATFEVNDSFLSTPLKVCIERDKGRESYERVGEKVIVKMAEDQIPHLLPDLIGRTSAGPQLFLDLDGVLADFDGFISKEFGIENNRENERSDFWDTLRGYQGRLYFDMGPLPLAKELWNALKVFSPIILTGCPWSIAGAADDKREWVAQHISPTVEVVCCKSRNKRLYAKPGDVIVDDWTKYQDLWEAHGGNFVHYTGQPVQTIVELVKNAMRQIPVIMEGS